MAQTAAHLVECGLPWYGMHQAGTRGFERAHRLPGSITFLQRFGTALNLHLHAHLLFLEGVYCDRPEASRKPRLVTGEAPSEADVAAVVQNISQRVIPKLRSLGDLEAGSDTAVATGDAPLAEDAPALAGTLAAAVQ
jgi:Putative transposase